MVARQKRKAAPVALICAHCGQEFTRSKAAIAYSPNSGRRYGLHCSKECYWRHKADKRQDIPARRCCTKCGEEKPFTSEYFGVRRHKNLPHDLTPQCKPCIAKKARSVNPRYKQKLKRDVLTAYGGGILRCVCCDERHIDFLTLDHLKGRGHGAAERRTCTQNSIFTRLRREGYPQGDYRTLCHNCNVAYGMYGRCPHQLASEANSDPVI